jgi:putative oxidoreductase
MNKFFNAVLRNNALVAGGLLVARLLLAVPFLTFGTSKVLHTAQIQQYMVAHHVAPNLVYLTIVVQIGFGAFMAAGYQTRLAAMMLAGFCIIATSLFHTDFSVAGELAQFTKDLAIAGGFLVVIAQGPGWLSVDAYIEHNRQRRLAYEPQPSQHRV